MITGCITTRHILFHPVIIITLALLLAGCGSAGEFDASSAGDITVSIGVGQSNVDPAETISVIFNKGVEALTVNERTVFVVPADDSENECDASKRLPGHIFCSPATDCTISPIGLDLCRSYRLCLSPEIEFDDGTVFSGDAVVFTTTCCGDAFAGPCSSGGVSNFGDAALTYEELAADTKASGLPDAAAECVCREAFEAGEGVCITNARMDASSGSCGLGEQ